MTTHQFAQIVLRCAKMLVALLEKELKTTKDAATT